MQGVWMIPAFLILFLGWNAYTDLKKRQISLLSVLLTGILGIAILIPAQTRQWILSDGESIKSLLFGIAVGGGLYLLSLATDGAIGRGDALVFTLMGLYLGLYRLLFLLMGSFLLCGFTGSVLLLLKKAGRKSKLPLIPFVLMAYLILLLWEGDSYVQNQY